MECILTKVCGVVLLAVGILLSGSILQELPRSYDKCFGLALLVITISFCIFGLMFLLI